MRIRNQRRQTRCGDRRGNSILVGSYVRQADVVHIGSSTRQFRRIVGQQHADLRHVIFARFGQRLTTGPRPPAAGE